MNKTYILQKDLPTVKAGTKFELNDNGDQYVCVDEAGKCGHFFKETVESKPDWFIEEKPKTAEIVYFARHRRNNDPCWYEVSSSEPIPQEKFPQIKAAIEKVLNDDCLFDAEKINTQVDKIKIAADAFHAARATLTIGVDVCGSHNYVSSFYAKFPTFLSFINK